MTRVIHTADTHIGYRQYHADERRLDFLTAFERVIEDAIDEDVDAVVHAGDLFHDKRPELADLQGTVAALARLRRADIPFLGVVGNHERKRDTQWLDLFEDLGLATRLDTAPTLIDGVACYGLDYVTPTQRERVKPTFKPPGDVRASLLVTHGIVKGFPHGDWDLPSFLEGAPVSFDAVLLGDYHEHEIRYTDGTVYTYPGSTERVSADETTERGYNLVTIEDDISITHRALPGTRSFVFTEIELRGEEGIRHVRERLRQYELDDAVVIVTLLGEGQPVSPAEVETFTLEEGALVARVRDHRDHEMEEDTGISVSFGDPDIAVRERLEQERLSDAVMQIDGIVRDLTVPDSNVRDRIHERVRSLLEEDPSTLEVPDEPPEEEIAADSQEMAEVSEETATSEGSSTDETESDDGEEVPLTTTSGQASMEDYL